MQKAVAIFHCSENIAQAIIATHWFYAFDFAFFIDFTIGQFLFSAHELYLLSSTQMFYSQDFSDMSFKHIICIRS